MTILHTADWHLGARLVNHDREEEHEFFLNWLLEQIHHKNVDLLIVAGDIFDSANPPQSALTQYYRFLAALSAKQNCATVIIAGNHDSPAVMNAPKPLLRSMRIFVHGAAESDIPLAVHEFPDAVVCAVPYLREKDVRTAAAGESHEEVVSAIREGIKAYYQKLRTVASPLAAGRPLVATGHLTAIGVMGASSERAIQIGNLGAVGAECFEGFDYVALGHIHRPQRVGGRNHIRYSGSPLPLAFDETTCPKQVVLITTNRGEPVQIEEIPVPTWRNLTSVECDLINLLPALRQVAAKSDSLRTWVEIRITDAVPPTEMETQVSQAAANAGVEVLKVVRSIGESSPVDSPLAGRQLHETSPEEVFLERLRRAGVDDGSPDHVELLGTFRELMSWMANQEAAA